MEKAILEKIAKARELSLARDKSAEGIAVEALKDAIASGKARYIADAYYALSNVYHQTLFNSQKAHEYILLAKEYIEDDTPLALKLNIYSMLGTTFMAIHDFISAQQYFMEALSFVNDEEEEDKEIIYILVVLNFDFGIMYFNIGMYEFGYDFIKIASRLCQKIDSKSMSMQCKNAIASYYFHTKHYDKALAMFNEISTELGSSEPNERLAVVSHYTAIIYAEMGDYKKAEEYYQQALSARLHIGNEVRLSFSYFGFSKLYYKMGNREKGDHYFELLKEIIAKHSYFFSEDKLNDIYWELYGERGDYELAYQYSKKIEMSVVEPKLVQKILKTVFEKEKEKQAEIFSQAQTLKHINQEMQDYAKQLEISNKDLSSFAHITSHDLREPLRMISTYMTILEKKIKDKLTENENVFLKYVVEGTKKMDEMITRILKNARGEENTSPIVLDELLVQVKTNLSKLIQDKKAIVHVDKLPVISGDEIHFIQIFQNLISNAIKYNNSEVPEIFVQADRKDNFYEIRVVDNGVGIPESERKRAFEMFQRVENSSGAEGTGIGLSTVKNIIEKMKGTIHIESNEPQGSIFVMRFPIK